MSDQFHGDPVRSGDNDMSVYLRRIAAHVIDFLVLMTLLVPMILATSTIHYDAPSGFCSSAGLSASQCFQQGPTAIEFGGGGVNTLTLVLVGFWVIVGLVEGMTGAFVGKRALGLRVVAIEGGRLGPVRGAIRGLFMFADSTFCFVIGLGVSLATRPHRRLGDFVARSLVVPVSKASATTTSAEQSRSAVDPITWDSYRDAWVHTDPFTGDRSKWDASAQQWGPLDT